MKIVVIGGTGLIGSKLVALLRQRLQEVLAASPDSGVNTLTGEGLPEALAGAQVVVDVANSLSFEDAAVIKFFQTAGRNLLAAESTADVRHHVRFFLIKRVVMSTLRILGTALVLSFSAQLTQPTRASEPQPESRGSRSDFRSVDFLCRAGFTPAQAAQGFAINEGSSKPKPFLRWPALERDFH